VPRRKMPDRRRSWTQRASIPDFNGAPQTFYLSFGEYDDGTLGEIWIEASRMETFARGVLGALARSFSGRIQDGCPPPEAIAMLRGMDFPPRGPVTAGGSPVTDCKSVADWIAQEIEAAYVTGAAARPVRWVERYAEELPPDPPDDELPTAVEIPDGPFDGTYPNPSRRAVFSKQGHQDSADRKD
jgi:hypothetical protein